jgi:hypothetical protein
MISSSYEGLVQMEPDLKNGEFFSGDDDFTYQVPRVYFECAGDIHDTHSVFDWSQNSITTFKDNRALKCTEYIYNQFLMTDENGESYWCDGIYEFFTEEYLKYASDIRPIKSYMIEEFDWNKSEKRRYKVILEETSKLNEYDEPYLKKVIDRDIKRGGDYTLRDTD